MWYPGWNRQCLDQTSWLSGWRWNHHYSVSTSLVFPNCLSGNTVAVHEFLPTAYVVREEVIFSLCVSVHIWGGTPSRSGQGGYPIQVWTGGGTPSRSGWGGTPSRSRWGRPPGVTPPLGRGGACLGYPPGRGGTCLRYPSQQGGAHLGYPPGRGHPPGAPPSRGGAHLGYPLPGRGGACLGYPPWQGGTCLGYPPQQGGACLGYPPPWQGGARLGYPPPPHQNIAWTCYAAVGEPLAC